MPTEGTNPRAGVNVPELASVGRFWVTAEDNHEKINPTRVPIEEKESVRWLENLKQATTLLNEPERCIHIGDRESDIYELFCVAQEAGTHFLVRTCVDRLAEDGTRTISQEMDEAQSKCLHRVDVRDQQGIALKPPWRFNGAGFWSSLRSGNRNDTPNSR